MSYLLTSEFVCRGHPDKLSDFACDSLLDEHLLQDQYSRTAFEATFTKDLVLVTGEVSSNASVDIESVVRKAICDSGYDRDENSYNGNTVQILNKVGKQSHEIARAVAGDNIIKAGDQGIMSGGACSEVGYPFFMPLTHHLARELVILLEEERKNNLNSPIKPDGKTQITIQYDENNNPLFIHTIVISTQHSPSLNIKSLREYVTDNILNKFKESWGHFVTDKTKILINPSLEWTVGGPCADSGLSGRKIIVDNYGPAVDFCVGGGSYSGKDAATKVDRSGAYVSRWICKNMVAAKLCSSCQMQIAFVIGVADPVGIKVKAKNPIKNINFEQMVRDLVDLTPSGIADRLGLRKPIYRKTAYDGHFGKLPNQGYSWEDLDLVDEFKKYVG